MNPTPPLPGSAASNPSSARAIPGGNGRPSSLPGAPVPLLTGKAWLGIFVTLGLIAFTWSHTFIEMWGRWFPAWRNPHYGLMDKLTQGDSYYSHGPLVPLTSLIVAFFIYRRVGVPCRRTSGSTFLGWVTFLFFLLLHLAAVSPGARQVNFVSAFALIGVLGGLVLIWGGWSLAKAYWLPVVMLVFMVPLPEVAIYNLNFQLKGMASDVSVWATNTIFGIPAVKAGSFVFLPDAPDGSPKQLVIENVCGGLRSLISLTFFAALFAMVCRAHGLWRVFLLLLAVPVAVLSNIIRITSLNVVAHYFGVEAAGEKSTFHNLSGLAVFVIALAILFGIEQLIIVAGKALKRTWGDPRLLGFLDDMIWTRGQEVSPLRAAPLALLGIAGIVTFISLRSGPAHNVSNLAQGAVPATLVVEGRSYTSVDFEIEQKVRDILETDDLLARRYLPSDSAGGGIRPVDILIVFSANNRKGTHPPEVCLDGSGDKIIASAVRTIDIPGLGPMSMRELVTQRGQSQTYHLYFYKCGASYTSSFLRQQATIFLNGLFWRNSAGALIRLSAGAPNGELDRTRDQVIRMTQQLVPIIAAKLP